MVPRHDRPLFCSLRAEPTSDLLRADEILADRRAQVRAHSERHVREIDAGARQMALESHSRRSIILAYDVQASQARRMGIGVAVVDFLDQKRVGAEIDALHQAYKLHFMAHPLLGARPLPVEEEVCAVGRGPCPASEIYNDVRAHRTVHFCDAERHAADLAFASTSLALSRSEEVGVDEALRYAQDPAGRRKRKFELALHDTIRWLFRGGMCGELGWNGSSSHSRDYRDLLHESRGAVEILRLTGCATLPALRALADVDGTDADGAPGAAPLAQLVIEGAGLCVTGPAAKRVAVEALSRSLLPDHLAAALLGCIAVDPALVGGYLAALESSRCTDLLNAGRYPWKADNGGPINPAEAVKALRRALLRPAHRRAARAALYGGVPAPSDADVARVDLEELRAMLAGRDALRTALVPGAPRGGEATAALGTLCEGQDPFTLGRDLSGRVAAALAEAADVARERAVLWVRRLAQLRSAAPFTVMVPEGADDAAILTEAARLRAWARRRTRTGGPWEAAADRDGTDEVERAEALARRLGRVNLAATIVAARDALERKVKRAKKAAMERRKEGRNATPEEEEAAARPDPPTNPHVDMLPETLAALGEDAEFECHDVLRRAAEAPGLDEALRTFAAQARGALEAEIARAVRERFAATLEDVRQFYGYVAATRAGPGGRRLVILGAGPAGRVLADVEIFKMWTFMGHEGPGFFLANTGRGGLNGRSAVRQWQVNHWTSDADATGVLPDGGNAAFTTCDVSGRRKRFLVIPRRGFDILGVQIE
eukprot:tig00000042_g15681.t1